MPPIPTRLIGSGREEGQVPQRNKKRNSRVRQIGPFNGPKTDRGASLKKTTETNSIPKSSHQKVKEKKTAPKKKKGGAKSGGTLKKHSQKIAARQSGGGRVGALKKRL